jgi:hypothetical protein
MSRLINLNGESPECCDATNLLGRRRDSAELYWSGTARILGSGRHKLRWLTMLRGFHMFPAMRVVFKRLISRISRPVLG